jgi:hypothetical protein
VWLECEGWTYPNALLEFRHGREAVGNVTVFQRARYWTLSMRMYIGY